MRTIPIVVPGIMGSSLRYDHFKAGLPLLLWSEDIRLNYERLIKSPGSLSWSGNRAKAALIPDFTVSASIPILGRSLSLKRVSVWGRVLSWIEQHPAFAHGKVISFGYDWRGPLIETAAELAICMSEAVGRDVSLTRDDEDAKFCVVAHSMGGIVALLAIGKGIVHPTWIDRLFLIGTPLNGAPSAFSAAYHEVNLPFFAELFALVRRRNMTLFHKHLLECIRTFPSIYSLLPPQEVPYLYYGHSSRSNPLREDSMPEALRALAIETHSFLLRAREIIGISKVEAYTVYTEVDSRRQTDLEYRVTPHGRDYGYTIEELIASTAYGDGTVPSESARGGSPFRFKTVTNVDHAFLCNDPEVVECLTSLVPQQRSYAS
ncbi:MAG: esterase/lipase family protein [Acidobacteriaceae bacterium]